jgi:hypothetical protein
MSPTSPIAIAGSYSSRKTLRVHILSAIVTLTLSLSVQSQSSEGSRFIRFAGDSEWGYSVVADPTGLAPAEMVERFELRPGDCTSVPPYNDCSLGAERAERAQARRPNKPVSGSEWYRWNIFFPEDFVNTYPAKTRHGQFVDHGSQDSAWALEIGSTGVLWLGAQFAEESVYFSLIDENELRGKWHQIIVHAVWSSNEGKIDVWTNGQKKVSYEGPTCIRCRVFFSYGVHRINASNFQKKFPGSILPIQIVFYTQPESAWVDPHWITPQPGTEPETESGILQTAAEPGSGSADSRTDSKVVSAEVESGLNQITVSETPDNAEVSEASSLIEPSQSTAEEAEIKKMNDDDRPEGGKARASAQ